MVDPYRLLAKRLNELPNGFPPTEDGAELLLLAKIFSPGEASLAASLRASLETPDQIGTRLGIDDPSLREQLKSMARRGLIAAGRIEGGLGYRLMPFVVGIYEMQIGRIDAELAGYFESYYRLAFGEILRVEPHVHRVIPIGESVKVGIEIRPYESAAEILAGASAWGVLDCICRVQKALVGDPCGHPVDICMALSDRPGVFDNNPIVKALTQEEALATLRRAAEVGLVHSVSNSRSGISYICNCCTCSCGILRGIADLGIANVVARSPFVNAVDEARCICCEDCLNACQFGALTMGEAAVALDGTHCVGCGVCVLACPEEALGLVRRPDGEVTAIPESEADWMRQRAIARGIEMEGAASSY
jgi:Fe-S-cluster-containing hydrogenase component 2